MSLTEPCIFKIYFFEEPDICIKAIKKIKRALKLDTGVGRPATSLQNFLKKIADHAIPTGDGFQDTSCEFASDLHQLKVRYYPYQKADVRKGIFILTVSLNSKSPDVIQGWQELEKRFPANIPYNLIDPITVYYAISDEEVTAAGVTNLAQSVLTGLSQEKLRQDFKKAHLRCGSLYQFSPHEADEKYFLFSKKEQEDEASKFATLSLPSLNVYLYCGNVRAQDTELRVPSVRSHMKEVSERIKNKLNDYSSKGFGSITSEAERMDIFEIAKDLWMLNNNASQMLNLLETINIYLYNFRNLKEKLVMPGSEEIFCQKERLLELQKAQLQADAAYLHHTFASGRVVLESIEDHMELEYTRELKESNKKALTLQSATFIIEFAIVFYYFLGSWHYIMGEKFYKFPTLTRFLCATTIAMGVCAGTHLFYAKWCLTKKNYYLFWLLGILPPFLFTIGYIVLYSLKL